MNNIKKIANKIIKESEEDLDEGWERTTIILQIEPFEHLKTISDIKGMFIKDIVNELIKIYNSVAITEKDKQNIEKEKKQLQEKIKKLVTVQEKAKEDEQMQEGEAEENA